ncbi:MAG: FecR domain-containing protein [Planctomycetota bacterium]
MKDVQAAILEHLNGESSAAQSREVSEWIQANPENARQFAEIALVHGQMRSMLSGKRRAQDSGVLNESAIPPVEPDFDSRPNAKAARRKTRLKPALFALAAIAACLLIAASITFKRSDEQTPGQVAGSGFATIRQVSEVVWTGEEYSPDERVGNGIIELDSGIVRLIFDSGVDITLEGPARYELVSGEQTMLSAGVLMANVPPGAEGFRVDTPSARVIDLGTSFGVNVGAEGVADILVFDGQVEVVSSNTDSEMRIGEGESVRFTSNGAMQKTEFNVRRFERMWSIASGISSASSSFRLTPPWPRRVRLRESDDEIFLLPEGYVIDLESPLAVNVSKPGEYDATDQLTPAEIATGERVRTYLLHFSPEERSGREAPNSVSGSITFDQPVVGLIVLQDELVQSASLTGLRAGELQPRRQLELGGENGDRISLSEDLRTLTVELSSPGRGGDLIRVVVDGEHGPDGVMERRRRRGRENRISE